MKKYGKRLVAVIVAFVICALLFVVRLVNLQLVNGAAYYKSSSNSVVTKTVVKAARGDILDRNCEPIVQSVSQVSVVINRQKTDDLNATIDALIGFFEKCEDDYTDTFPVAYTNGAFSFTPAYMQSESLRSSFSKYLASKKIETADDPLSVMTELFKAYSLADRDPERATKIVGVRYEIETGAGGSEYTFAEDVGIKTSTMIEENKSSLPGVTLITSSAREYTMPGIASHILGTVGRISAEEYETLSSKGYLFDDIVGKDGIEKVCEDYLRGQNGYRYTINDDSGTVVSDIGDLASEEGYASVDAKSGFDVILTIDSKMQTVVEKGLEELLVSCREINGEDSASAAAAIFMDPNSGEILAMASNPTFNIKTYNADYSTLVANENKPLINRAISGLYAPGSTYKMVTGIAGLEEGIITKYSTRYCEGIYRFYDDYQPSCFRSISHGEVNVVTALKHSCNIFFFDVGRIAGIDTLNSYSAKLGFGKKTGIELPGEMSGIIAGRTYRESIGKTWEDGETLLAAIGQSDNAVTPLQLVNYVATIGNGGKFYSPHIIKSIRDAEKNETVYSSSTSYEDLGLKQETLQAVVEGMVEVSKTGGSAGSGFADYTLSSIAVKTGTAEVDGKKATSLLVGFAPAENPQVAFVLVVENAGTGTTPLNAKYITQVLQYWFSDRDKFDGVR